MKNSVELYKQTGAAADHAVASALRKEKDMFFNVCHKELEYMRERIRKEYPAGCRVRLVQMSDPQAPPPGTEGTVRTVDDTGTIHVHWDNGSSLGVIYGEDACQRV